MRQQLALIIPFQFLSREPAHALHETALDLSAIDGFVDRVAGIMEDVGSQNAMHPGETIHLDFGHRRAASEIMERLATTSGAVPMNARSAVVAGRREAYALEIGPADHFGKGEFEAWNS